MSSIKGTVGVKIASVVLGITTAVWLGGMAYFMMPAPAHAQTVEDLQAQINSLLEQIATLQAQLAAQQGGSSSGFFHVFNQNLSMGMDNSEVAALQQALDMEGCFNFNSYTGYFGPITRDGVNCFQSKYASSVLTPLGLSGPTGFVGPSTRAKLNELFGTQPSGDTGDTGGDTGDDTGDAVSGNVLKVESVDQPSDTLAVQNAAGVPFTNFKVTAGSQDVTIDSITVERNGLANDAAFSGIILLEGNERIGLAKTLNSLHQATLTEDVTIMAGESRTFTIGGDMASDLSSYAGQVPQLVVTAINLKGSATLEGDLPITGATHTIDSSLTIGSATVEIGSLDPGSSVTKKVGDADDYYFSSVKITAGSAEDVRLLSIRWNQSGSAASDDLANVVTVVDGTEYPTTVSSNGKYYSTDFGNGILIEKGFNKTVSIRGDIVSGSGRTVDFDIFRLTDIVVNGEDFDYNITPSITDSGDSATDDDGSFQTANPIFDAYEVTIDTGSITISSSNAINAQNVAENVAEEIIGAFDIDVKGEDISVGSMDFYFGVTGTGDAQDLTNITLSNLDTGEVVAGPNDASGGKVSFSETVIFPVGKQAYVLKGKYGSDFANNDTVQASTTPSSDFSTVEGQTTNVSITPSPTSAVSGKTMTVKTAAVTISVQNTPIAQNVVAGKKGFTFANYELDATNSGDDVKFASLPLEYRVMSGSTATDLTNCLLYDGSTVVSDEVNPTAAASSTNFTMLGTGLVVPKGTTKVLSLECDINSGASANSQFSWGYDTSSSPSPTGVNSGQSATVTENDSMGQLMTIQTSGSYSVTNDNTPGYRIVNAGTTGVTLLRLKFSATDEDLDVRRVNLQLSGTASNTPTDLVGQKVTLWDGSNKIGEATFGAGGDFATSSLIASGDFTVPKDGEKTMLVKGDISNIGVSGPLTKSGDLLKVDFDGDANGLNNGNYAVGTGSGSNITPSSSDTSIGGVRIMESYPKFAKVDLSGSDLTLQSGTARTFYRFKVTAVGGDVEFYKFTFQISSSTGTNANGTTTNYALYAYDDSNFASPDTTFNQSPGGLLNAANCYYPSGGYADWGGMASDPSEVGIHGADINIFMDSSASTCGDSNTSTTTYEIPAGESRWFELQADVTGVETTTGTESMEVSLQGDAAYPAVVVVNSKGQDSTLELGKAADVNTDTNDDLIWSPVSTTTTLSLEDVDFTNGFLVPGLPTTNMSKEILESAN